MTTRQEVRGKNRQNLTRESVTSAAISLIEDDGLDALTMRRLATELDCGTMSLYSHVRNRDDLIEAVVGELIDRLDLRSTPDETWQSVVRRTVGSYRDLAVQLPSAFELLALAPYESAPVAPHLARLVASLEKSGLTPDQARQVLGITDAYATGFLVVWVRSRAVRASTPALRASTTDIGSLRDLEMFDRGLDALIAGLGTTLDEWAPGTQVG